MGLFTDKTVADLKCFHQVKESLEKAGLEVFKLLLLIKLISGVVLNNENWYERF